MSLSILVSRDQPDNKVYFARYSDFENLQESPAAFNDTPIGAIASLLNECPQDLEY